MRGFRVDTVAEYHKGPVFCISFSAFPVLAFSQSVLPQCCEMAAVIAEIIKRQRCSETERDCLSLGFLLCVCVLRASPVAQQ